MVRVSRVGEELIADLAETLDIPPERYASADRSYRSVCAWLERPQSRFAKINIEAYTQGSFRLGTAIRPVTGKEHYDLDIVCEFSLSKSMLTQQMLYADLGYDLRLYANRYDMDSPSSSRRCWTLNYADTAQFHMDVLPSVPDGLRQRELREARSVSLAYVDRSISITDSEHENFQRKCDEWPISNPNGYAEWFYERMRPAFEQRRRAMMLAEAKAEVTEIPAFRVKTPLQSAIQILKRHRDMRFSEEPEGRPTSIVLTTLAAHAYQQEATISGALFSILERMEFFIERRSEGYWIANPSDPRENFADHWQDEPRRKDAFYDWLDIARSDFGRAAEQDDAAEIVETLAARMGRQLVETAASKRHRTTGSTGSLTRGVSRALRRILDAPHRKPVVWPTVRAGIVQIISATAERSGFRPVALSTDDSPVARGASLRFVAQTSVTRPYKVYWQVVNTGSAASAAKDLRGGFEEVSTETGTLTKEENASYSGSHSIECFIVQNGYCVAHSGPFVVNID